MPPPKCCPVRNMGAWLGIVVTSRRAYIPTLGGQIFVICWAEPKLPIESIFFQIFPKSKGMAPKILAPHCSKYWDAQLGITKLVPTSWGLQGMVMP